MPDTISRGIRDVPSPHAAVLGSCCSADLPSSLTEIKEAQQKYDVGALSKEAGTDDGADRIGFCILQGLPYGHSLVKDVSTKYQLVVPNVYFCLSLASVTLSHTFIVLLIN